MLGPGRQLIEKVTRHGGGGGGVRWLSRGGGRSGNTSQTDQLSLLDWIAGRWTDNWSC